MFDDDQLTQSPELRELRDSLNDVAMPARPPLAAIEARGRTHRRHRHSGLAGLFVAGAAAGAAVTVALAGGGSTHQDALPALTGKSHPPREIKTSTYTLISDTSGKVKLTIKLGKLFRPARLQSDLARFGIPAKVTDGRFCTSDPAPTGLSRVVSPGTGGRQSITFDPAAIPAGTELSFGRLRLKEHAQVVGIALVKAGSYSCSTRLSSELMHGEWLGYARIPAGPATSHG
jgi:hypothetical protein